MLHFISYLANRIFPQTKSKPEDLSSIQSDLLICVVVNSCYILNGLLIGIQNANDGYTGIQYTVYPYILLDWCSSRAGLWWCQFPIVQRHCIERIGCKPQDLKRKKNHLQSGLLAVAPNNWQHAPPEETQNPKHLWSICYSQALRHGPKLDHNWQRCNEAEASAPHSWNDWTWILPADTLSPIYMKEIDLILESPKLWF